MLNVSHEIVAANGLEEPVPHSNGRSPNKARPVPSLDGSIDCEAKSYEGYLRDTNVVSACATLHQFCERKEVDSTQHYYGLVENFKLVVKSPFVRSYTYEISRKKQVDRVSRNELQGIRLLAVERQEQ